MKEKGKQIVFGEETGLTLEYDSLADFKEKMQNYWHFNRITIIASPTKAIVVPCIPPCTDKSEHRAGILITNSTTFKL